MRIRATVCLLLCLVLRSSAQTSITVPVVDKSESGSPLEISGNVTFTDHVIGNSINSSSDYELKAKNVSGKGIILLSAYFIEMGPRAGGIGHYINWDRFFSDEELAPETVFVLDRSTGGRQGGYFDPLGSGRDPVVEVRVLYAEFSDGSTYGQRREVREVLDDRSAIIEALRHLDKATDDGSFLQTLVQNLRPDRPGRFDRGRYFFERVNHVQQQKGTSAARSLVHDELANAERHLAVMRSSAAPAKPVLKRYEMSGHVTWVSPESKKIKVYNDEISGFMEPREMEYAVREQATLTGIKAGDTIHATLLSDNDETWVLENPVVTENP